MSESLGKGDSGEYMSVNSRKGAGLPVDQRDLQPEPGSWEGKRKMKRVLSKRKRDTYTLDREQYN